MNLFLPAVVGVLGTVVTFVIAILGIASIRTLWRSDWAYEPGFWADVEIALKFVISLFGSICVVAVLIAGFVFSWNWFALEVMAS